MKKLLGVAIVLIIGFETSADIVQIGTYTLNPGCTMADVSSLAWQGQKVMASRDQSYRFEFLVPAVSGDLGAIVELGRARSLDVMGRDFEGWFVELERDSDGDVGAYVEELTRCLTPQTRSWYNAITDNAPAGDIVQITHWTPTGRCDVEDIVENGRNLGRILEDGSYGSFTSELVMPIASSDMTSIVDIDRTVTMEDMGRAMARFGERGSDLGTPESRQAAMSDLCATAASSNWYRSTGASGD